MSFLKKTKAGKTDKLKKPGSGIEKTSESEMLAGRSEKRGKIEPGKQPSENTEKTPAVTNGDLQTKAIQQAPQTDITSVKRAGSQKEKIFDIKKLGIGEEFPEALVTAGRQHEPETELVDPLKVNTPQTGTEDSVMTPDSSSPSTELNLDKELDANLIIASTPWTDKLLPFQTTVWDSKHDEDKLLITTRMQELIQLYVDIGLANNIIWMATELGHRSKELDESYTKLCKNIAERINYIQADASHDKIE